MKGRIVLLLGFLQALPAFSQLCPPNILTQQERPYITAGSLGSHRRTADGGYILGGYAYEGTSADKTNPGYGIADFFLVRLDSNLNKVWDQSYGGTNSDSLSVVQQTADGGFILGGESWSGASGNKTATNYGRSDFWIVRTDSDGNVLWDRSYGGTNFDTVFDLRQTADGGFILGGISISEPSGNKTSGAYGGTDYWVVRVDPFGNKIWDRSFGGPGEDHLSSIIETSDGGFLVAGSSDSAPGGTKTESYYGFWDYWIVRLDGDGNELWQRSFGGNSFDDLRKVRQGTNGNFILVGASDSFPGGTKSSPKRGGRDYWVLAVDATGQQLWEQSVGGSGFAEPRDVSPMPNGGWVIGGNADTGAGGNRTSYGFGSGDYWLVRFDALGNILWDQSYGGRAYESLRDMELTSAGEIVLVGESSSRIGGNKTTPLQNYIDLWVLKLGLETPGDCDGDGVPDGQDSCPTTSVGASVNTNGCSIAQLCPCKGGWTNHDEYVQCVSQRAQEFLQSGFINEDQRSNLVAQAVVANCPFIPTPIIAFGLTNYAIEQASVGFGEESGGALVANEIGDNGLDGISTVLGEADSGFFIYPDAPVQYSYSEAWFMLAKAYGSLNGVTNSLLSTMRARKPDYETYPVDVDFSAVGAESLTYQVYNGNELVIEATEPGAVGSITIHSATYLGPRGNPFFRAPDGSIGAVIDLDTSETPYRFTITGPFYTSSGDHIFIRANNPTNAADFVSRVDVTAGGGLDHFSELNGRLGMFHRAHQAVGDALLNARAGKLHVDQRTDTTLQNYGFVGTAVEANNVSRFDMQVEPIRLETNRVFEFYVVGLFEVHQSGSAQEVNQSSLITVTNADDTLHLRADFSSLYNFEGTNTEPRMVLLNVYHNGALAGSLTNLSGNFSFSATSAVPAFVNCGAAGTSNTAFHVAFTLDRAADFTDSSGIVLRGNQVRLYPIEPASSPEAISLASLVTRELSSFTIVGEEAESGPPALAIAIVAGNIVLSWPNENRPFILESTSSLTEPFATVSADVKFEQNRNTVTIPFEPTSNRFFRLRLSPD